MEIQFSEFIPYLLVWMCGEFNYESNGPFGIENGVRTWKLRPKRRNREIWPFGQKGQVSGREWLATMPLWHCRMPMSRPSQGCMREWHATMPFWHSRGHSRPCQLIRVFNLISFLISHSNISQLFSLGFSRFWAILETQVLISKGFSESITTLATIVEGVIIFSFIKLHHHCWWVSHFLGFCSNPSG
jgi:hypothetical protein